MAQIAVSYLMVILYISSVVTFTLLVGILPVYVNRPICDEQDGQQRLEIAIPREQTVLSPKAGLPVCIEFTYPEIGVVEPWFNARLPSNVQPIAYEIELTVGAVDRQNSYDGDLTVTVMLTYQTDTFIVHKHSTTVEVKAMLDRNDNPIEIFCYGEYPNNDYYVFKTLSEVQIDQSPLKIQFEFASRLDVYENGIFQIDFGLRKTPGYIFHVLKFVLFPDKKRKYEFSIKYLY